MALVSGRTHIAFDGRYLMKEIETPSRELRKTITFNKKHDLGVAPDPTCVRILERFFPGTLLSVRFFIDPMHLDEVPDYAKDHRPR